MRLTWLGHSCFLFENDAGKRLLIDPFDATVGYPVPDMPVDVVVTSHDHFDHNYVGALPDGYRRIHAPGAYECAGYHITGIPSFHDDRGGARRGANTIFKIAADGASAVHLGDLGHMPDETQAAFIRGADALLVPVGGVFTIDGTQAARLVRDAQPKVAIPMHYKTAPLSFDIADESAFVRAFPRAVALDSNTLDLAKEPPAPVVVLRYA